MELSTFTRRWADGLGAMAESLLEYGLPQSAASEALSDGDEDVSSHEPNRSWRAVRRRREIRREGSSGRSLESGR